jgi:hypothetical protein
MAGMSESTPPRTAISPSMCHLSSTTPANAGEDWNIYPERTKNASSDIYDRAFYHRRLLNDASRLFAPNKVELEKMCRHWESEYELHLY